MDAFEAYKLYLAVKNHFSQKSYDYFKYNGKTRTNKLSFDTRKDKYMFHKLSKKKEPLQFLVSNFVKHHTNIWIGEMVSEPEHEKTYLDWKRKQESLTYVFTQDLQRLLPSIDDCIRVIDGQHPKLLKMYLQDTINIETLIIIDRACNMFSYWNKKLKDDVIWEDIYLKCIKYAPFITFDKSKMNKIIINTFEVNTDANVLVQHQPQ